MPGDAGRVTKLKRSHPWFMDASEPELVCNKKKAIEDVNNRTVSGTPNMTGSLWENTPNFQKANESFISSGPIFDTGSASIIPVGLTHDKVNTNVISMETTYKKINSCSSSMDHKYNKGERSSIYFNGFQSDPDANNPSGRIISSYGLLMSQPSVQPFEVPPQAPGLKDSVLPNSEPSLNVSATSTSQNDATAKTKVQKRTTAQKTPGNVSQNNFLSNAKSLLATGIFDGVPVKYVSWSRDKSLKGIIQGASYLCGCKDCKGSKALKACEFEVHAGGKTKRTQTIIFILRRVRPSLQQFRS